MNKRLASLINSPSPLLLCLLLLSVLPALLASAPAAAKPAQINEKTHPPGNSQPPPSGCLVIVTGPTDVMRIEDKPRTDIFGFGSPDPRAPHFLRIDNGGSSGQMQPVTSAQVYWNGAIELGPDSFGRHVQTIERNVTAEAENQLSFRLSGKPGSGLAFSVLAIDDVGPTFGDVFPPDGSLQSVPEVTLVVMLEDALSGVQSLTCADVDAVEIDGDFVCTVPLAVGENLIELVATDACGNVGSEFITIEYDPPPVVTITSPDDGDLIIKGPAEVTGTVDDPAATVTVNGVPASGRPNFSASVPVRRGTNTLVAVAQDAAGGEGSDSVEITVLVGLDGPTVRITQPERDFLVGGPRPVSPYPVEVRGQVLTTDSSNPSVSVNGLAASVTSAGCQLLGICHWIFSATLQLDMANNPQQIEAVVTDGNGQMDSDVIVGNVDECLVTPTPPNGDGNAILDAGRGQSNRCHDIDGCSAPRSLFPNPNDPVGGSLGHSSTAFGRDEPNGHDPHGAAPQNDLPCNNHDVCYQTCAAGDEGHKKACDDTMYDEMVAVCQAAYPELLCPYTLTQPLLCPAWSLEKNRCYRLALEYRTGLRFDEWKDDRYGEKQSQFCWP